MAEVPDLGGLVEGNRWSFGGGALLSEESIVLSMWLSSLIRRFILHYLRPCP